MHAKNFLLSFTVAAAMAALLMAKPNAQPPSGALMIQAANTFLESLSDVEKQQASFAYDDEERLNWHFIPRERKGIPLKSLEGDRLRSAHRLVSSGLSKAGYEQALNVMSLEEILYLLETGDRKERRARRDPLNYYLSIFGKPATTGAWGWRFEGHHLSLNYSIVDGELTATTPEFFGANPGVVDAGPGRAVRVLGPEEEGARQILKLCSPEQERIAWIEKTAPRDLRGGGVAQPETTPPVGLSAAKMSSDQRRLLGELLDEYLKNMPADVEGQRRAEINQAGLDSIHFAWWGGADRNEPHYYRVQGPTFLIEYNNTQNKANHVHSIWRNLAGDFDVMLKN
jgi:hypothetical protein